jgi:hypothetical protein
MTVPRRTRALALNEGDQTVNHSELPTPLELNDAPELAVLAVLDTAIETTARTLIALYPGLCHQVGHPSEQDPEFKSASRLLRQADRLVNAVARYRAQVLRESVKNDASDGPDSLSAEPF